MLSDDALLKIFKKRRFLGFGMMKNLENHIIQAKFLSEDERIKLEEFEAKEDAKAAEEENSGVVDGISKWNWYQKRPKWQGW